MTHVESQAQWDLSALELAGRDWFLSPAVRKWHKLNFGHYLKLGSHGKKKIVLFESLVMIIKTVMS